MGPTPLFQALQASATSSPSTAYRGAITAAHFDSPRKEFAALAEGCAVYDLGFLGRISITGSDRVRWLNGMVSNNVRDLAIGHGVYSFLLNAQGRILGDMHIYNLGESILVETDRRQIDKLVATFDHYIIMDDVALADISDKETAIGIGGPGSREILRNAGIEISELKPLQIETPRCACDCNCLECTVIRGEEIEGEHYEIWLDPSAAHKTWQALIEAGATGVGCETLDTWRIARGVPLYGVDIRERDLPQETEQMRALNFNKGCYVGQEIVERIRSRGNVHRTFAGFQIEASAEASGIAATPGSKVFSGEKEVGEITSAANIPMRSGERTIALGYVRREHAESGQILTVGGTRASVVRLPIVKSSASAKSMTGDSVLHTA